MMQLVVFAFTSLDGVSQAPGGPDEDRDGGFAHGGWSFRYMDPEVVGRAISAGLDRAEALLFGRRTYDGMAAAWPERAGDPFADRMNSIEKHVASRTYGPEDLTWSNSHLLEGDAVGAVSSLKASRDGELHIWGSTDLTSQLLGAGLVDELVLMLEPIVLGGGKSIFPTDGTAVPLELISVEQACTGVLVCRYRTAADDPDAPRTYDEAVEAHVAELNGPVPPL